MDKPDIPAMKNSIPDEQAGGPYTVEQEAERRYPVSVERDLKRHANFRSRMRKAFIEGARWQAGQSSPSSLSDEETWHRDPWLIGNVEAWEKSPPTDDQPDDDAHTKQARAILREEMAAHGWDIYGGSTYPWVRAMNYAWEEGFLGGLRYARDHGLLRSPAGSDEPTQPEEHGKEV